MTLDEKALEAFKAHALRCYPEEACGVLVGAGYVPCTNVAENKRRDWKISRDEFMQIRLKYGNYKAVLHTHTYDPAQAPDHPVEWPSGMDMQNWMKGKKPWGIAACDGEGLSEVYWLNDKKREPLVGREFKWGVNDCYSLVRDWFKQERGIDLPNFPREWKFWEKGIALYEDNFASAGFAEVQPDEVRPGDCVLMRLIGPVSSHAAVVTGTDEILHHLFHRQSGYDSLHKWMRQITRYVRYVGVPQ